MPHHSDPGNNPQGARLRILQTTDLHMHLIPYDYDAMAPALDRGLAYLQDEIQALRTAGIATLLCDTGDFLQGNALADIAIETHGVHPMIATFNALAYDAVVLGNHDFEYGLPKLRQALDDLACPALAANLQINVAPQIAVPHHMVAVEADGVTLNVGLLGLTATPPPMVCRTENPPFVSMSPVVETAKASVATLMAEGADLIVALCHFGIDADDQTENAVTAIAQIDGIDAILAGHTHDVFPGPDAPQGPGVDPGAGRVHGVPTVMAGAFGRGLGQIDLTLDQADGGWRVTAAHCQVVRPRPTPVPPPLSAPGLLAAHEATLAQLKSPIAQTNVRLTTALSMIAPDQSQYLLAQARMAQVRADLADGPFADLPLIGSAAPYLAGNRDAPSAFLDVQPGPVTISDAMAMFPFQDPIIGLRQTGAQVRDWLEAAAARFRTLLPGQTQQDLIDPSFPPYNFKTLFGLTYRFDVSRPIGARVVDLRINGKALLATDHVVVATTPTRRSGKSMASTADILSISDDISKTVLIRHIRRLGTINLALPDVWNFVPLQETAAQFVTTANAPTNGIRHDLTPMETVGDGLQQFSMTFD